MRTIALLLLSLTFVAACGASGPSSRKGEPAPLPTREFEPPPERPPPPEPPQMPEPPPPPAEPQADPHPHPHGSP